MTVRNCNFVCWLRYYNKPMSIRRRKKSKCSLKNHFGPLSKEPQFTFIAYLSNVPTLKKDVISSRRQSEKWKNFATELAMPHQELTLWWGGESHLRLYLAYKRLMFSFVDAFYRNDVTSLPDSFVRPIKSLSPHSSEKKTFLSLNEKPTLCCLSL